MSDAIVAGGVTVAILAGGESRRMGRDKAFVTVDGVPLIERVLGVVAGLGDENVLITNRPDDYAHLGWPMQGDVQPGRGALGGILTAVTVARQPHVLVVACDMPWLQRPLLAHLIALRTTADVVVPQWGHYPEPLHAVYAQRCRSFIERQLADGNLKVSDFYGDVAVRRVERAELEQFDPGGISFTNLNTPEDVAGAGREDG